MSGGHVAPEGPMPAPPIVTVLKRGTSEPAGQFFFAAKFAFGERVSIDSGDQVGTVIGFCFYPHGQQIQVSWWNNGALVESWVAEWRLALIEK